MIVTDRLVFLHLHKSGGTFVNVLLMRCIRPAQQIGYHLPYRELPSIYRNLPVVGTVRNPWAFYVSWYHFQSSQAEPNILYQVCSNGGQLGFKDTVTNLVRLAEDETRLALLEKGLPDTFASFGLNLTKKCVGELRERGLGFYSFLYERLYADTQNPMILRMEFLREQLRAALTSFGYLPNECAERFLKEAPAFNTSVHGPPAAYFDDDLAGLVAERDETVIDRYGYSLSGELADL
jgi:hypothetical protein